MKLNLFSYLILLFSFQAGAQPVTELNETDVYFSPTLTIPGKIRSMRKADSTVLPAGHYKTELPEMTQDVVRPVEENHYNG